MNNIDPIDRNRLLKDLEAEAFTTYEEEVQMLYLNSTLATIKAQPSLPKNDNHLHELGMAWLIIANATGGNLPSSEGWVEAAENWHQRYIEILKENLHE